jgi:L-lactate dehydrogenase (cytochrome)
LNGEVNRAMRRPTKSGVLSLVPAKKAGEFMPTVTCVEDLREAAHRKVPRMFIDYLEAGS